MAPSFETSSSSSSFAGSSSGNIPRSADQEDVKRKLVMKEPVSKSAAASDSSSANSKFKVKMRADFLRRMYAKVHSYCGKDPGNTTLFTMAILVASEMPMHFFTLLDILQLKSLFKYRLHYDPSEASHLGVRKYPPLGLIWKAFKVSERNFLFAYLIPATAAILAANKLKIFVYETEEEGVNWKRILLESLAISVGADVFFYLLHRLVHQPSMYKDWHKMHHEFKYTIAYAHHWMTYKEALIFMFPQVAPPLIMWAITGRKTHILSMWIAFVFTQINGTLGHAGWRIPGLPRWFPFFQPAYHDHHHVDYSGNFAAVYPLTDMVFGTYNHPKLDNGGKVWSNYLAKNVGKPRRARAPWPYKAA